MPASVVASIDCARSGLTLTDSSMWRPCVAVRILILYLDEIRGNTDETSKRKDSLLCQGQVTLQRKFG